MFDPIVFKTNLYLLKNRVSHRFRQDVIPAWFRRASVLILFWEEDHHIKLVLTKRSPDIANHKGEVCFPGGKVENDETFEQAALREAEEEIGIDKNRVEIIGRLDETWSGAAFNLVPVVGWYDGIPQFHKNDREVEEILVFDCDELLNESELKTDVLEHNGADFEFSIINSSLATVFGLSADLLLEVLELGKGNSVQRGIKRERELKKALETDLFGRLRKSHR